MSIIGVARFGTITPPVVAVVYSLVVLLVTTFSPLPVPTGAFQGGSLMVFPVAMALAIIAWKWPLPGGIACVITGLPLLVMTVTARGWGLYYTIPYTILSIAYIAGGLLHILGFFLQKRQVNT
jgi:hypothetical protein